MPKKKVEDGRFVGGFVRSRGDGAPVRVNRCKPEDLPPVDPRMAQERLSAVQASGPYDPAVAPLRARQTKLAVLGIPAAVLSSGSPAYMRCVKLAKAYKKARQKELYIAHGYVSSGVGALLAAASLALSASRFLYEIAANSEVMPTERGQLGMPQLLKLASSLSDSARQNELSAWELCAREAVIHRRNESSKQALPWELAAGPAGNPNGEVKRGRGRPRKYALAQENDNAGTDVPRTIESSSTEDGGENPWDETEGD